eukprot:XP_028338368.1 uncharacterized protein LOC114484692 [Physeter catodon]
MGSTPRPPCTCPGGPADAEGVPPPSVRHTHTGERWLGHRQLPSGSGDRVEKGLPWFTFTQTPTCGASRAVRPAGEDRGSQPDSRKQADKVSSQKVSEGPSLVQGEHLQEERARALEARGEGSRGQSTGPTGLASDCPQTVLVPPGKAWTIPILCRGVTRPFRNQPPVTESRWQGHFRLPMTLAEMSMVWSGRGASQTEETISAPRKRRSGGGGWGRQRQGRLPTTGPGAQTFAPLVVRVSVLFPNSLEQGVWGTGLTNCSLRQHMARYTAGVS